ncbi:S16 family serine protease, partial [Enterobacter hormaechei]|uniref:S16 family serine protease n=1 Tax=Enterobacter hormaechei TaxID=158836 RepID=UPI0035A320D5
MVKEIALAGPQPVKAKKGAKKKALVSVSSKNLDKYLGVRRFDFGRAEEENEIGLVTGLA